MNEMIKNISPIDEISDIWKPLTYEERIYLRENTKFLEFKKNEYIYRDGEMPEYMFFLLEGHVKIYREGVCGRQQLLRIICPKNLFGYRAYFSNSRYVATAVGIDNVSLYAVPLSVFKQIIESNNKLSVYFIGLLSQELAIADMRLVSLTQKHVRGRLAETILKLIEIYGIDPNTKNINGYLSREDLAGYANMTASNAIRTLSSFDSEKLLEVNGKRIRVLDIDQLTKISQQG